MILFLKSLFDFYSDCYINLHAGLKFKPCIHLKIACDRNQISNEILIIFFSSKGYSTKYVTISSCYYINLLDNHSDLI